MRTKSTKPYAKSTLSIVIAGNKRGEHLVKTVRVAGHPMNAPAQERALEVLKQTVCNGNRIISATLSLITEELREQCAKVFQPSVLKALKQAQ